MTSRKKSSSSSSTSRSSELETTTTSTATTTTASSPSVGTRSSGRMGTIFQEVSAPPGRLAPLSSSSSGNSSSSSSNSNRTAMTDTTMGGVAKTKFTPKVPIRKKKPPPDAVGSLLDVAVKGEPAAADDRGHGRGRGRGKPAPSSLPQKGPVAFVGVSTPKFRENDLLRYAQPSAQPKEEGKETRKATERRSAKEKETAVAQDSGTKGRRSVLAAAVKQEPESQDEIDSKETADMHEMFSVGVQQPIMTPFAALVEEPLRPSSPLIPPKLAYPPDEEEDQPIFVQQIPPPGAFLFSNPNDLTFSEDKLFFFQLPQALPSVVSMETLSSSFASAASTAASSSSETPGPAPLGGGELPTTALAGMTKREADFVNELQTWPEGKVGRLDIHLSGRMRLTVGDDLVYDVASGTDCAFHQSVVAVDASSSSAFVMGDVAHRFICTPDVDRLLLSLKDKEDQKARS